MSIAVIDAAAQERDKYAEIWTTVPEYKNYSPGLANVDRFMSVVKPEPGSSLVDVGCGAGVAGLAFAEKGLSVHWVDITDAGLDQKVPRDRFIQTPLWNASWRKGQSPRPGRLDVWDYAFCCDVMEHIPPEYTMLCVDRILARCGLAWFQISLRPDEFGKMIGEPLHLTVRDYSWWLIRMATLGKVLDARDLCGDALFVVEGAWAPLKLEAAA